MAEFEAQAKPGLAQFQRVHQVLAGDETVGRLLGAVIAFVAAPPQHLARQQAGVGLQRHTLCIACAGRHQARQVNAGIQQQRQAGVQHVGHGRVHPFHRGAGTRGAVCSAVGKLAAHGAGIAKPCKGLADLLAREAAVVLHASTPIGGPAQRGDQFARQAKGQVKPAHPGLGLGQPLGQSRQGLDALQPQQLHARTIAAAQCQHDGFAAAGAAGEVAADQIKNNGGRHGSAHPKASAVTPAAMHTAPHTRASRSPSPSKCPPISAANSMDTSRAGATCDRGACCMAYSTST